MQRNSFEHCVYLDVKICGSLVLRFSRVSPCVLSVLYKVLSVMYTVPWIIDNMILEPTEITKLRRPSEVELKVQKSLQKLTVPDWYANKCVPSPKIIVDRRPFESRPAPWKDPVRNRGQLKIPTANTAVAKPVVEEKMRPDSESERLSQVTKNSSVKSPGSYSSGTFPKISPSRKIQNINIVFPTTKTLGESKNDENPIETEFLDNSVGSIDSLDKFTPQKTSSIENKPTPMAVSTPIKTSTVRALAFQDSPKISKMGCPPPAVPETLPNIPIRERLSFQDQTFTTPEKLPNTEKILLSPVRKIANADFVTPKKSAPPVPLTPPPKTAGKNRSSFLEQSSMDESVFLTPKKSTEMESIIKNQQKRLSGRSFVDEIIQELNAKCSPRVKSNYVSPTSKNFVKKLVRALEMGCTPKSNDEDKITGSCSDLESKSSISMKDSDSGSGSDCELKSSASQISRDGTFRSFSMALEGRGKMSRESIVPYVDDEDESVYWIPLPTCKLPRTSSLKNMMSRLSSQGGSSSPISSSPDSGASREPASSWQPTNLQNPNASGWGKTFDKRQLRSRQLFRIDETTVIDSGYSDRSGTNSSSSSVVDESWYEDSETTQTASEIGDEYENTYSSHVRPRGILGHRQRTFVVQC